MPALLDSRWGWSYSLCSYYNNKNVFHIVFYNMVHVFCHKNGKWNLFFSRFEFIIFIWCFAVNKDARNVIPFVTVTKRYIGCPTRYRTRHFFNNFTVSQQLGALHTHTTDTFLFISHTTNVLLFKFLCNIFIGVRIIKEIPGSVASGTHCVSKIQCAESKHHPFF